MVKLGELIMILQLHRQGLSVAAIARETGKDAKTIRRCIARGLEAPVYGPRPPQACRLDPYKAYLQERIAACPQLSGRFFVGETRLIRDHVASVAAAAGRPVEYLAAASTHRSGRSKEARARQIAERDGVTEGLVCVLSVVEPCRSFAVVPNRQTQRLEVVHRPRKCLHYYLYFIDPEFGWMHVRLQTWAPYEIQVNINGREWLARQLDRAGIGYQRSDNKITAVDDLAKALE